MKTLNTVACLVCLTAAFVIPSFAAPGATVHCSNATLKGTYGFAINGQVNEDGSAFLPVSFLGTISFDGEGNLSGGDTTMLAGTLYTETFKGTYQISGDCGGSLVANADSGEVYNYQFVVVAGAKELKIVEIDPGTAIAGTASRQ